MQKVEIPSYSVSELTFLLKKTLEPNFSQVVVKGEISNCKRQSSGHIYFTLKDTHAQLSCAFFKGAQRNANISLKDGDHVELSGEISIYAPRGSYQLIVRSAKLLGIGELLLRFQQLKELLSQRGWFDEKYKKPIPPFPQKIAVITSSTGSVIRDIIHVLSRRFSGVHIYLYPAKVQGEGAANEIAKGIEEINRLQLADVIIVARGGGSIEDLWPFNEEVVAKNIFHSVIPVISAVGHETDFTLADFVADVRAPTPSAAAEIVVKEAKEQSLFLRRSAAHLIKMMQNKLSLYRSSLQRVLVHPFLTSSYDLLRVKLQYFDDLKESIEQSFERFFQEKARKMELLGKEIALFSPKAKLQFHRSLLDDSKKQLDYLMHSIVRGKKNLFLQKDFSSRMEGKLFSLISFYKNRLQQLSNHLRGIDPKNLLKKGYSILFSENDGSIILSSKSVVKGDRISAKLADGSILADVISTKDITHD